MRHTIHETCCLSSGIIKWDERKRTEREREISLLTEILKRLLKEKHPQNTEIYKKLGNLSQTEGEREMVE